MQLSELDFEYPPELVATEPKRPSRVAYFAQGCEPEELKLDDLITRFSPGDLLVLNNTQVTPMRVFGRDSRTHNEREFLFLKPDQPDAKTWEVLFASRDCKLQDEFALPGGVLATLQQKGIPQLITTSQPLDANYFNTHGEMALPPYIQQARQERHNRGRDREWYQTAWASQPGAVAAPTASLHFTQEHLKRLQQQDVQIAEITLHVGAGTFLPVRTENLTDHQMHGEWVDVPKKVIELIRQTRQNQKKVWALGTTVVRALESQARGLLTQDQDHYLGESKLFIFPPYQFQAVDILMTNFHQPRSTLLALVAAYAGSIKEVRVCYDWAIQRQMRLFSYGDLSVWSRS